MPFLPQFNQSTLLHLKLLLFLPKVLGFEIALTQFMDFHLTFSSLNPVPSKGKGPPVDRSTHLQTIREQMLMLCQRDEFLHSQYDE
jgi:hypothetical protein